MENLGLAEINKEEQITIDGGNHGYLWSSGGSSGGSSLDFGEVVEIAVDTLTDAAETIIDGLESAWDSIFG
ncbi:hypothetical protein J8L88_02600 [Aquimarina sp. MMG015]|uniref:hypothetical protein n=1 Tax=Aquimarina sp. MMG015 TaxID=2822689 RepID=UPI001B39DD24|nr:hypothetical protein [Aquimarina sp. MMG015]MBQ4801726.1 hypothetical protein [Aquimarina sp. MMG015]